jgi:hypothetical protein
VYRGPSADERMISQRRKVTKLWCMDIRQNDLGAERFPKVQRDWNRRLTLMDTNILEHRFLAALRG